MAQTFPALLINLDKDTDRLATCTRLFESAAITFTRVAGVKGNAPPQHLAKQFANSPLKAGEIGCYASHLLAMEQVHRPTLICEDNLTIPDVASFKPTVEALLKALPSEWDLVHLMKPKKATSPVASPISGHRLVRLSKVQRGLSAYLLSPSGAAKILKATPRIWTIDDDVKTFWRFHLDIYGVKPGLVQRAKIPSTIDAIEHRGHKFRHFRTFNFDQYTRGIPLSIQHMGFQPWLLCQLKNLVGAK